MSGWVVATEHPTRRFRPDLEGLRAVAVVLVLLYHAKIPGFTGGYVGVDVFFVLSGFLITGLLYRELRSTHQLSLATFYARRARRLLPAAGFALLCTLAASLWLLPGFRLSAVRTDIASAALYVSNMRFGFQANDYFQATAAASPVLHFWSLSVEEQFYIFWPAVLLFAHNGLPDIGTARARVAATIVVLGAFSLIGAILLTNVNQPWAFFLLPTRAWELAVGGLLAVFSRRVVAIPRPLASAATLVGVGFVVLAALLLDDNTAFPGFAAILPVTGAALVISGGFAQPVTRPSRILCLGAFRFLGRISYSLYLWHWPILVFGAALLGQQWAPLLALAAIPVAAASQRWVEQPFRGGRFIGILPSRNLLQAAGVGLVVVAAAFAITPPTAGDTIATTSGGAMPSVPSLSDASAETRPRGSGSPSSSAVAPAAVPSLAPDNPPKPCSDCTLSDLATALNDPLAGRSEGCWVGIASDPARCVLGYVSGERAVVAVFGDSHGQSWIPALTKLALIGTWRILDLTQGGCPSVDTPVWSNELKRAHTECDAWREVAFARLEVERPAVILISNSIHWSLVSGGDRVDQQARPPARWAGLWSKGLEKTLARLAPLHSKLVVIGDVPTPSYGGLDPLACIAQHATDFQVCGASRDTAVPKAVHDLERAIAISHGGTFVDPTSWLCDLDNCPAVIARYIVYADASGHLTTPFAQSLAGRLLAAVPFPK